MKILILGYSNLVKKKIIDVIVKNKIDFCIASKSSKKNEPKAYNWFRDYDEALKKSEANFVYISLPNSLHYYWSKRALKMNYNVVVDKPLCENLKQANELIKIAKQKNKLISEAVFFNFHKQFKRSIKIIGGYNKVKHISANFIIPMPLKKSLLLSKRFKGGALMDMGPYAAAVSRLIYKKDKLKNLSKVIKKNNKNLITSFKILCDYNNKTYSGNFSFGGQYQNNLVLYSDNISIEINRIFSPPSSNNLKLIVKKNNTIREVIISEDNAFENYINTIKNSKNNYDKFIKNIITDIRFRDKLAK